MLPQPMRIGTIGHITRSTKQTYASAPILGSVLYASMYRRGLLARAFSAVPKSSYILGQAKLQNIRSQQSNAHRLAIPSSTHFFHTSTCTRQLSQLAPTQQLLSKGELTQRQRPKPSHAPRYTNYFDEEVIWPDKLFPSEYSRPTLSEEQNRVLKKVVENKESVFFTGSAGTGKSVLLRAIIEALGGPSDEVVVTASTGIAAVNIGGQTLHSFAGAGLGNAPMEKLVQRVKWTAEARWRKAKTLIIDEVSMVDATWFDCLEEIARKIRKNRKPFGGLQLVICGDFFQLPPVPNREVTDAPASFVFDSWSWDKCIQTSITLTEVFRQKDPKLVKILNDARIGVVSDESAQILRSLARPVEYADGIGPTEIYPLRSQADHANRRRLMELPGESYSFDAEDWLGVDEDKERLSVERASDLLNRMVVPKRLKLKVGANVMCLRNVQGIGIVNGSTGRVIGFMRPRDFKIAMRRRSQWAVISSFEPDPEKRASGPARYENNEWPVVEFPDGMRALLGPVAFTVENKKEMIEVKRVQVPLILSWALTVHKSQGQTLDRVKIDLERTFEKGQAYVALSRCTSLEGLEVYNFSKTAIVAHPRVQRWSKQLISLNPYVKKPVRKGRTSVG